MTTAKYFSFTVGSLDCTVLLDGISALGRDRFLRAFPSATEPEYRRAYDDIDLAFDDAHIAFNILLVKMGDETVLIDVGEAGKPAGGQLPESLRQADIDPSAITLVVLTHSHGDHILGLLTDDQQAMFPNARYVISKAELAFWQDQIHMQATDQQSIIDMMQSQGLRLIEMNEEIIPGMTALPLPGHTPGQIGLLIESEDEKLLHLADALHTPVQFAHPEWSAKFDDDTSISVPTRRDALVRSADENLLTFFYHLTFPGLGHVKWSDEGFIWEPI